MAEATSWETGEHGGLVSIGTHRLYACITGPNRATPAAPIVVIFPGVTCSIKEWAGVRRMLQPFCRVLLYERSGFGASDESPADSPPTAQNIARELILLLAALSLQPPYVLLCHSYGGITSREFLHIKGENGTLSDVVGMIMVDANQERNCEIWPVPGFSEITRGLDLMEVTGLSHSVYLTDAEQKELIAENASMKHQRTAAREMEHYVESCEVLARKKQLERIPPLLGSETPVNILKGNAAGDLKKIFEAGVARGNGTPQQKEECLMRLGAYPAKDEEFQRGSLRLSGNSQFVVASEESGHSLHLTEPHKIVSGVRWVLGNMADGYV